MDTMLPKCIDHRATQHAFARAAASPKHDRCLGLFVRVLKEPSQPIDDLARGLFVTVSEHFSDVILDSRPITLDRIDHKATP